MIHGKFLPKIKKTAQLRSELTVENILESADAIFSENDPKNLNARNLATKSGYSVGTLYYYLNKAEDAFILMILKRREKHFHKLVALINQFPENKPLKDLLEEMIDSSFEEYNRMHHKSLFLIFRMILKFSKDPLVFDDALSHLVEPLISSQRRNMTGTFRELESDVLLMLLKTCFAIIRRPFLEQDPIAGTQKHRDLAIDTMARLLGNQSSDA